jgi:hypothetical protein
MGNSILQPTFTGGELSPSLYARVDLARYGTSVKTAKNFIVRPYGGLVNRPGFEFIGEVKDSTKRVRLIPFEFSTEIAYVIELGDGYMRFIYRGAYVLAESSTAYSAATSYALGALVLSGGTVYRSLQAANLNHTPASSPTWWEPNPVAQVDTPWTEAQLSEVAFTQSADVVYLTHNDYRPIELRRVTANTFEVRLFENKNGPFSPINSDESIKVAVSAETGNVTVEASEDIFTEGMVGSLFYVEEKDLRGQRPWEAGWRNVFAGTLCRSDGKVYRAVTVLTGGGATWSQTGGIRPIHDSGRAWDGPQDSRTTGTDTYTVGVEWEYLHSGFGVVLITGYTSPTEVTGVVTLRIPKSCVGGLGSPGTTWTLSGDGVTKTFSIPGATSDSESDYGVGIGGTPVQSNPYYHPPIGSGGGSKPGGGESGPIYAP